MFQPYLLELDGKPAGRFFETSGGTMEADVVTTHDLGLLNRKQLGRIRLTDLAIGCGPGMSRAFYNWVGSAFTGSFQRKDAAIVTLDHSSKAIARKEVRGAFVSSLVLPELDTSNAKQAVLMITLKPTSVSLHRSRDKRDLGSYTSGVSKSWRASDFRLKITGLETACLQVTHIAPLNLGEKIIEDQVGSSRTTDLLPAKSTFSDLVISVPKIHSDPFLAWSKDFVVKGNNTTDGEKEGSLDYLPPGSANPYFTVKLKGLGLKELASVSSGPVQIRMYCEEMIFSAGSSAIQ